MKDDPHPHTTVKFQNTGDKVNIVKVPCWKIGPRTKDKKMTRNGIGNLNNTGSKKTLG